jgi:hypothetical protein
MISIETCARASASSLSSTLGSSADLEGHARAFEASLRVEFKRMSDVSFAETFRSHCAVEGAGTEDYLNKEIVCPSGRRLVAGIRFRNLDLSRPFVSILAQDVPHLTREDIGWLASSLGDRFRVFAPRAFRLFTHASDLAWDDALPLSSAGKLLVAATLGEVDSFPVADGGAGSFGRLELQRAKDTSFYPAYVEAYANAYEAFPECREWARTEAEEDLAEMASEGRLFEILLDGRWAGIVGGSIGESFGLTGLHIEEIVLSPAARGGRIARRVQHELARVVLMEGLPRERWLSGYIGRANTPALRAALSAGRRVLGAEFWLPLEGT